MSQAAQAPPVQRGRVLVDTGPLVAMRNTPDQHRDRILELAPSLPATLHTTWPVLTETAFLLRSHPEEVQNILSSLGQELSVVTEKR